MIGTVERPVIGNRKQELRKSFPPGKLHSEDFRRMRLDSLLSDSQILGFVGI